MTEREWQGLPEKHAGGHRGALTTGARGGAARCQGLCYILCYTGHISGRRSAKAEKQPETRMDTGFAGVWSNAKQCRETAKNAILSLARLPIPPRRLCLRMHSDLNRNGINTRQDLRRWKIRASGKARGLDSGKNGIGEWLTG